MFDIFVIFLSTQLMVPPLCGMLTTAAAQLVKIVEWSDSLDQILITSHPQQSPNGLSIPAAGTVVSEHTKLIASVNETCTHTPDLWLLSAIMTISQYNARGQYF